MQNTEFDEPAYMRALAILPEQTELWFGAFTRELFSPSAGTLARIARNDEMGVALDGDVLRVLRIAAAIEAAEMAIEIAALLNRAAIVGVEKYVTVARDKHAAAIVDAIANY